MGKLVTQAQDAYSAWAAANKPSDVSGWTALTDEGAITIWKTEQTYLAAISDAQVIEDTFFAARASAFLTFEATKQSELAALQETWQKKEDAGYDVDA